MVMTLTFHIVRLEALRYCPMRWSRDWTRMPEVLSSRRFELGGIPCHVVVEANNKVDAVFDDGLAKRHIEADLICLAGVAFNTMRHVWASMTNRSMAVPVISGENPSMFTSTSMAANPVTGISLMRPTK